MSTKPTSVTQTLFPFERSTDLWAIQQLVVHFLMHGEFRCLFLGTANGQRLRTLLQLQRCETADPSRLSRVTSFAIISLNCQYPGMFGFCDMRQSFQVLFATHLFLVPHHHNFTGCERIISGQKYKFPLPQKLKRANELQNKFSAEGL